MYADIMLAVDLVNADTQLKAVGTAVKLAQTFGARLHVITVVPDYGMSIVGGYFTKDHERQAIEHANKALHAFVAEHVPTEIKLQHIVGHGTIYQEILRYAADTGCDLIVMASHRPELGDYLLGPNAARVVRHAGCSVMVVRD
ncbi:universal stress protein UspA [Thalassobaculum fulvum]|jgi:nucleotide-binding universal stress UspA family protein|uniref:Universal stress protein n=1 Tax=Thalassobaculum fulvum TaxID=1633335 RepID=A0A919CSK0_9PROT|nr:universal stress protein [Thalassobaculum fulvum]GHD63729.1 universal stress protein UspA [Thalassobaculum fulvum]